MKKLLLIAALTAFALPAHAADPLPRATPESVGLSPERLARIGALVDTEVREGRMPGAVVAIARRGKLAFYEAYGFQDGGRSRPMPRDAIFPIASMTKVLTGATVPGAKPRARKCSIAERNDQKRQLAAILSPEGASN